MYFCIIVSRLYFQDGKEFLLNYLTKFTINIR